jgi:hypothetical protein
MPRVYRKRRARVGNPVEYGAEKGGGVVSNVGEYASSRAGFGRGAVDDR